MMCRSRLFRCLALMVGLIAASGSVQAACSAPAGEAGQVSYAANLSIMVYCNGTDWVALGGQSTNVGHVLNDLSDVNTAGANNGNILVYSGGTWVVSDSAGAGAIALAGLTDVTISNLAGRDYLRYDADSSRWVNVPESTVMSTTTMVPGWPDAILCSSATASRTLYQQYFSPTDGMMLYATPYDGAGGRQYVTFNHNTKNYQNHSGLGDYDCVTGTKSISTLYAEGSAFNFIGNSGANGNAALGDRITSGTHTVTVNSATGVVSLSTAGTTWGYLTSTRSYLPALSSVQVSSTNVSATLLQVGTGHGAACDAGLVGSMRYTSGTMQVCDGSEWGNIGIGVPTGTIAAFAASSCPSGWTEYTPARGRFLRGIDNGAGNDPGGTRSPEHVQADAMQQITGTVALRPAQSGEAVISTNGAFSLSDGDSIGNFSGTGSKASRVVSFDSANSPGARTAIETRPKNVAVTFCVYSGFQSAPGQTILTTLASLTDVSIGGATPGQALIFDGASWVPSNTVSSGGSALGDRITSGTNVVSVNEDSGLVSLSTGGTTWGYLNSTRSYLPALSSVQVSSTNVSATLLQVGTGNGAACDASRRGSMRYSTVSSTMEYCNSSAWLSMGPSATDAIGFRAHNASTQTVAASTYEKMLLENEIFDTNSNFASGRFTATVPGTYYFSAIVTCKATTGGCNGQLYVNGSAVLTGSFSSSANDNYSTVSGLLRLNSGDYVELWGRNTGATTMSNGTYLQGFLVGPQSGGSGGATALSGLSDVNTSGAATGSILAFDGASWVVSDSLAGGSALGDRIVSGTASVTAHEDKSLTFSTGNQQRMLVGENGRVGIGTGAPEAALHVAGAAYLPVTGRLENALRTTREFGVFTFMGNYPKREIRIPFNPADSVNARFKIHVHSTPDNSFATRQTLTKEIYLVTDNTGGIAAQHSYVTFRHFNNAASNIRISDFTIDGGTNELVLIIQFNTTSSRKFLIYMEALGQKSEQLLAATVSNQVDGAQNEVPDQDYSPPTDGPVRLADALVVSSSSLTCNAGAEGGIRYNAGTLQLCNGTSWGSLGGGGSGGGTIIASGTVAGLATLEIGNLGDYDEVVIDLWNVRPVTDNTDLEARFKQGGSFVSANGSYIWGNTAAGTNLNSINANLMRMAAAHGNTANENAHYTIKLLRPGAASFRKGMTWSGARANTATTVGGVVGAAYMIANNNPIEAVGFFFSVGNIAEASYVATGYRHSGSGGGDSGGATALAELTDVSVAGATAGQALVYDGANWIASTTTRDGGGGDALGDRITSGTNVVSVNEASGLVSLSTGGTTWGYLNSTRSYLPALSSVQVSSTNVSATLLQVGTGNGAACDASRRGSMRYSTVSSTMEYCNSSAWVSMGPSATVVPSFFAYSNAQQSIPANTSTKVDLNATLFDTNSNFDTSTSRFTPTVPGTYILTANANYHSLAANNYASLQIAKNGTSISRVLFRSGSSADHAGRTISAIVQANGTGDYFEIFTHQTHTSDANLIGNQNQVNFSGALISMAGGGIGGGGSDNLGNHIAEQDLTMGSNKTTFGSATGDKIHLYSNTYGIGVESSTLTQWSNSQFRWRTGGTSAATGTQQMLLNSSGVTAEAFLYSSDARLKENVRDLTGGLAKLEALNPVTFRYASDTTRRERLGFIAQDVERAYPQAVVTGDDGMKSVDYPSLVPALAGALKELKAENDNLKALLNDERTLRSELARSLADYRETQAAQIMDGLEQSQRMRHLEAANDNLKAMNAEILRRLDRLESRKAATQ